MNGSIFLETAPPPDSLISANEQPPPVDSRQILSFQDQLLSLLEPIEGKIKTVDERIKRTYTNRDYNSKGIADELNMRLKDAQSKMSRVHEITVNLSRKIQAISLSNQTATTLAAPKQVKPIQDEFFQLKDEFDDSLKNIATLSRNLTAKIDNKNCQIERIKTVGTEAQKIQSQIKDLKRINEKNKDQISEMQNEMERKLSELTEKLKMEFETQIDDAEKLIEKLDQETEEGLSRSSKTVSRFQEQKFDIKTSFDAISDEIQKRMTSQLDALHEKIQKLERAGIQTVEDFQNGLTRDLDALAEESATVLRNSMLDDIEYEKELAQIETLLAEIDDLKSQIENEKPDGIPDKFRLCEGMSGGQMKTFKCYANGTFEII